jgi:hypothetical protein
LPPITYSSTYYFNDPWLSSLFLHPYFKVCYGLCPDFECSWVLTLPDVSSISPLVGNVMGRDMLLAGKGPQEDMQISLDGFGDRPPRQLPYKGVFSKTIE